MGGIIESQRADEKVKQDTDAKLKIFIVPKPRFAA